MHCHICDKTLSEDEIKYEEDHKQWAPCRECIEAAGLFFKKPSEDGDELDGYYILDNSFDSTG